MNINPSLNTSAPRLPVSPEKLSKQGERAGAAQPDSPAAVSEPATAQARSLDTDEVKPLPFENLESALKSLADLKKTIAHQSGTALEAQANLQPATVRKLVWG